jgi:hypothetical protein
MSRSWSGYNPFSAPAVRSWFVILWERTSALYPAGGTAPRFEDKHDKQCKQYKDGYRERQQGAT